MENLRASEILLTNDNFARLAKTLSGFEVHRHCGHDKAN